MQKISSRADEGVLLIAQDNVLRELVVLGIDEDLAERLELDLQEKVLFTQILPKKIASYLEDELEYEQGAKDFLEIINTMRQLPLKSKQGKEHLCQFRIVRDVPHNKCDVFRVIVTFIEHKRNKTSPLEALKHDFTLHTVLDEDTHLPTASSFERYIELSQHYSVQKNIVIAFVYVDITEAVLQENSHLLIAHIGHVISRNLRQDDVVGVMNNQALGILLMDVNQATVHMALTRIRMMLQHDPYLLPTGEPLHPMVRLSCVVLNDKQTAAEIIALSQKLLADDPQRDMVVYRDKNLVEQPHLLYAKP
jgi:GGDEF domain-containing protein